MCSNMMYVIIISGCQGPIWWPFQFVVKYRIIGRYLHYSDMTACAFYAIIPKLLKRCFLSVDKEEITVLFPH